MHTTLGLSEPRTVSLTIHHAESLLVPFHSTHQESMVLPRIWSRFIPREATPTAQWLQRWVSTSQYCCPEERAWEHKAWLEANLSGLQELSFGKLDTVTVRRSVDTDRLQERLPSSKVGLMAPGGENQNMTSQLWRFVLWGPQIAKSSCVSLNAIQFYLY